MDRYKLINLSLEFESYKLDDLGKIYSGGTPSTKVPEYWDGDLNWLSSGETRDTYIYTTEKTISQLGADKSSTKLAKKGDIVIASAGQGFTRGQASMVMIDTFVNQSVIVIHPNNKINNHFLLYNLKYRYNELRQLSDHTSTRGSLTTKIIKDLDINLPNLETQNKIANFITIIDKKIRANDQINHNLEELAQTILNENFFIFSHYSENELCDTDIGKIPKDWKIFKLKDLFNHIKPGTNFQPKRTEEGIPFLNVRNINSGFIDLSDVKYISIEDYKQVHKTWAPEENDILISRIGTLGLTTIISKEDLPLAVHYNFINVKSEKLPYQFVYFLFKSNNFQRKYHTIKKYSVQEYVTIDDFSDIEIALPKNLNDINSELKIFNSIFNKIQRNITEVKKLNNLRDYLLPKLMSGEIDVSEVNCDLKLYFSNSILKLTIRIRRYFNMKTKIISKIQNQMKPFLNQGQYLKLTNSLLNSFKDVEILDNNNESNEIDNFKLLNSFLSAKQVEGRSEKTIVYYKSTLEKMLTKVNKQVYNITTDDIRKYLYEHKQEKNSSKITIDNMRRIFSSFFSWLEDEDYILKNPIRRIHRVKTGRVVKEVLTDENLEVLRDNCEEIRDLAIVEILISTGIRVGELVRLNIEDINFYERECVVFGKGESERVVYFDARTKIHLIEYLESRTDENPALFVSLNNPHERLGISGVETRLRELGKKCNIPKVHPHKFRRTLATNAIDKGMPIEQVQKLLGHVQIDTTMQYAMVNQSNVKIAHRKFIS